MFVFLVWLFFGGFVVVVLRLTRKYISHLQRVRDYTFKPMLDHYDHRAGNGFLSCHSCCEAKPLFMLFNPKDHPFKLIFLVVTNISFYKVVATVVLTYLKWLHNWLCFLGLYLWLTWRDCGLKHLFCLSMQIFTFFNMLSVLIWMLIWSCLGTVCELA